MEISCRHLFSGLPPCLFSANPDDNLQCPWHTPRLFHPELAPSSYLLSCLFGRRGLAAWPHPALLAVRWDPVPSLGRELWEATWVPLRAEAFRASSPAVERPEAMCHGMEPGASSLQRPGSLSECMEEGCLFLPSPPRLSLY